MAYGTDDLGARVRAARQYKNLSQTELAKALGNDRRVIASIEDDSDPRELQVPEARQIAEICGVPLSFLTTGWIAPPDLEERVSQLETDLQAESLERAARVLEVTQRLDAMRDPKVRPRARRQP